MATQLGGWTGAAISLSLIFHIPMTSTKKARRFISEKTSILNYYYYCWKNIIPPTSSLSYSENSLCFSSWEKIELKYKHTYGAWNKNWSYSKFGHVDRTRNVSPFILLLLLLLLFMIWKRISHLWIIIISNLFCLRNYYLRKDIHVEAAGMCALYKVSIVRYGSGSLLFIFRFSSSFLFTFWEELWATKRKSHPIYTHKW